MQTYQEVATRVATPPASPAVTIRPRKGVLVRFWHLLFGEPNEAERAIKHATSHGASAIKNARRMSLPLLISFSIAAVVVLGGSALQHNISGFIQGAANGGVLDGLAALNFVELAELSVIVFFVIAADYAMMAASTKVRDAHNMGEQAGKYLIHLVVMLGISAIEASTFVLMVAGLEHPQSFGEWAFIIARAVGVVLVVNYTAILTARPLSDEDVDMLLNLKSSAALLAYIDQQVDVGRADFAQLMQLRLLLTARDLPKHVRAAKLVEAIERLNPTTQAAALQAEMDRVKAEAEARVQATIEQARQLLMRSLLHLSQGAGLPEDVVAFVPELAGVSFNLAPAKGRGKATAKEPTSRAEAMRQWLGERSLAVVPTPEGRRGVWVKSSVIPALTEDRIKGDLATKLAKELGDQATYGSGYVCPMDRLMPELYMRQALTNEARAWWDSLVASNLSTDEEMGVAGPTSRPAARRQRRA